MKIRNIILSILSIILLSSCGWWEDIEQDLLEVDPLGKSTVDSFLSSYEGYQAAGEGMHKELRDFYNKDYIKYAEIKGDLLDITSKADEGSTLLYNYKMDAEQVATYPRTVWADGWSVVRAANNLIAYGPVNIKHFTLPTEQKQIKRIMAQAYFARAIGHFNLCNCYAQPYNFTEDHSHLGIPILTKIPSFEQVLKRVPISNVYKQVISDLESSLKLFKEIDEEGIKDPYHISYIASEALLARVYLYMGDWENAEKYSSSVMSKIKLSPRNEYENMFRMSQTTKGEETILRMDSYNHQSAPASFFDPTRTYAFYPTNSMIEKFDDKDIRKSLLIYVPESNEEEIYQGKTYPAVCKFLYKKSISNPMEKVEDCFILRGSEMYLIHAESVLEGKSNIEAAYKDIQVLEARALGESNLSLQRPNSVEECRKMIEQERIKELCFEGHRIFDIIRKGQSLVRPSENNVSVKEIQYPDNRFVLPIDRMEMQANDNMVQNPGYQSYR